MKHSFGGRKRDIDVDMIRVVASFGVVMIHIPHSYSLSSVFYFSATRFCIPIFCIISGYYLLDREETWRLRGKCLRLFLRMVTWSGVYYIYELTTGKLAFEGFPALGTYLLTMPPHLWYFYTVIALYLFTPLFSAFARHASRREYRHILALAFCFGSLVTLALRTGRTPVLETVVEKMKLDPTLGFVFCYLWAGYYKRFGLSKGERRWIYVCALLGTAVPVVLFLARGAESELVNLLLFSFFSPNALAQAIAVFAGVKELRSAHPAVWERLGTWPHLLVSCTLGTCFVHPLVIELADPWLQKALCSIRPGLTVPIRAATVYALSLLTILVMKWIPALKRMVTL